MQGYGTSLTNPMISTHPSGSFLILGRRSLFASGISAALSSFAHLARWSQQKIVSLAHQSTSVTTDSNIPFPKSLLQASRIAGSLSLSLIEGRRD